MGIRSLKISNVQSIGAEVELPDLGRLNILIGPNSSGKSALLRALVLLLRNHSSGHDTWIRHGQPQASVEVGFDCAVDDLRKTWTAIPTGNGHVSMGNFEPLASRFDDNMLWHIKFAINKGTANPNVLVASRVGPLEITSHNAARMDGIARFDVPSSANLHTWSVSMLNRLVEPSRFVYIPTFRQLAKEENPNFVNRATDTGENLANMLLRFEKSTDARERQKWKTIQSTIHRVLGLKIQPSINSQGKVQVVLEDEVSGERSSVSESGSGIENFLTYIVFVLQQDAKLVLIEEPESHLHSRAQREMWQWFLEWARQTDGQFFITTHSTLPSEILLENDVRLFLVNKNESQETSVALTERHNWSTVLDTLGYWPNEWIGSDGLIIVEGKTDVDIVARWVKQLAPNRWIRVLRGTGKANALTAGTSTVFEQLEVPVGMVLDRSGKLPRDLNRLEKLVNVCVFRRNEIENYMLDSSALSHVTEKSKHEVQQVLDDVIQDIQWATLVDTLLDSLDIGLPRPYLDEFKSAFLSELCSGATILVEEISKSFPEFLSQQILKLPQHLKEDVVRVRIQETADQTFKTWETAWKESQLDLIPGKEVLRRALHRLCGGKQSLDVYASSLAQYVAPPEELREMISSMFE